MVFSAKNCEELGGNGENVLKNGLVSFNGAKNGKETRELGLGMTL